MSPSTKDRLLQWFLRACASLAGVITIFMALFVFAESLPALRNIGISRLFGESSWHPAAEESRRSFGLAPMLLGTLLTSAGAILIAGPLGILSAIFCNFYAPPQIAALYRRMIELLAGIPSVVYGFWGLLTIVPLIARIQPPGANLLTGIIILTIMILPTVALLSDAGLAAVPGYYLRGAAALGFSRWGAIRGVLLPAATSSLLTALILAAARALGETMALLMLCGNVAQMPQSLFAPVRTLSANIALEMAYATGDHRSALFVSGLALLTLVCLLAIAAEFLTSLPQESRA